MNGRKKWGNMAILIDYIWTKLETELPLFVFKKVNCNLKRLDLYLKTL